MGLWGNVWKFRLLYGDGQPRPGADGEWREVVLLDSVTAVVAAELIARQFDAGEYPESVPDYRRMELMFRGVSEVVDIATQIEVIYSVSVVKKDPA